MADDNSSPKYVLILRGLVTIAAGPTYETRVFTTLDEFHEFTARVDVPDEKLVGLYALGEPLTIAAEEKTETVEVTTREWRVSAEENQ